MGLKWILGPAERELLIDSVVTVILAITHEFEADSDDDETDGDA